jgi:hypothetical protein
MKTIQVWGRQVVVLSLLSGAWLVEAGSVLLRTPSLAAGVTNQWKQDATNAASGTTNVLGSAAWHSVSDFAITNPLVNNFSATNQYLFFMGDSLTSENGPWDWPSIARTNELFFKNRFAFYTNVASGSDGLSANYHSGMSVGATNSVATLSFVESHGWGYYYPVKIFVSSASNPMLNGFVQITNRVYDSNVPSAGTTIQAQWATGSTNGAWSDALVSWGVLTDYTNVIHKLMPINGAPAIVFVWIGTNDRNIMGSQAAIDAYLANLAMLSSWIHADGGTMVGFLLHPMHDMDNAGGDYDIRRMNFNNSYRGSTNIYDVLIDLESMFPNADDLRYFNRLHDVHFNYLGNQRIAAMVNAKMMAREHGRVLGP